MKPKKYAQSTGRVYTSGLDFRDGFLRAVYCLAAVPWIVGCASAAKSVNMVPERYDVANRHSSSVTLIVEGGRQTTITSEQSRISNADFLSALEQAIEQSGVFQEIRRSEDADYLLEVAILRLDQPTLGFNMEVQIVTNWKLIEASSAEVVWEDIMTTSHTATVGDAFLGVSRVRVATEGAAKKNIAKAIAELSQLDLTDCC